MYTGESPQGGWDILKPDIHSTGYATASYKVMISESDLRTSY